MAARSIKRLFRWRRRIVHGVMHATQTLMLPLLGPIISLLVIRFASPALWGEFVRIQLMLQLGIHVLGWGNRDYLIRAFSKHPAQVQQLWQSNLLTRLTLMAPVLPLLIGFSASVLHGVCFVMWIIAGVVDQSYEALVVYRKQFVGQLIIDVAGLAALAGGIVWQGNGLTLDGLIVVFTAVEAAKAAGLSLWLRGWSWLKAAWAIELPYFRAAGSFFLLGLSGLLQSRIDQYCITALLSLPEIAHYFIVSNCLIYLQSLANSLVIPVLKGLYRLRFAGILRLSRNLLLAGCLIVGPGLVALSIILSQLYAIQLPIRTLVIGGVSVIPLYYYLPIIYALYRENRQAVVLWINLGGAAINFLASVALIPTLRMEGALAANALAQLGMLLAYLYFADALRESHAHALP